MNSDYLFSLVVSLTLQSPIYITTDEVSRIGVGTSERRNESRHAIVALY